MRGTCHDDHDDGDEPAEKDLDEDYVINRRRGLSADILYLVWNSLMMALLTNGVVRRRLKAAPRS